MKKFCGILSFWGKLFSFFHWYLWKSLWKFFFFYNGLSNRLHHFLVFYFGLDLKKKKICFGLLLSFDMNWYKTIIIRFYFIFHALYFLYHQLKILLFFWLCSMTWKFAFLWHKQKNSLFKNKNLPCFIDVSLIIYALLMFHWCFLKHWELQSCFYSLLD